MPSTRRSNVCCIFMCLGIVLFSSGLKGCRKEWVIFPVVAISDEGDEIAFRAGPKARRGVLLNSDEARTFVLTLEGDTGEVIEIKQAKCASNIAWRPRTSPPELYVMVNAPRRPAPPRLMGIEVSNVPSTVFSEEMTEFPRDMIHDLEWSPDGSVLATTGLRSGLRLSYAGGETFAPTGLGATNLCFDVVWMSNARLYVRHGGRVQEVAFQSGLARISQTVASGKTRLWGILNGEVVYSIEDSIYCGDRLLYESTQKLGWVFADGPYLAFQVGSRTKDSHVSVLDEQGKVIAERPMPSDTIIIGLSSKRKCVYLLRDLRAIQACSFIDDNDISTIYSL